MSQSRSGEITIEREGNRFTGFLAQSDASSPKVLVYHAWWGLTPFFTDLTRRLASAGFTAFAPDLYDGKTAGTIEEAETMMQHRDRGRHEVIATSAVKWMQDQPSSYSGLGVIGFSMGGSWALDLSSMFPDAVRAVVLFYASGETDYSKVRARFQGHFAGQDEWTPRAEVEPMEAGLRSNGVQYEFFSYPDAQHWFFEANRPEYRERDANLAWERTVDFLRAELK